MPRPPGAPLDPHAYPVVDAVHAARSGISLERHFGVDELPRLRDASLSDASLRAAIGNGASDLDAKFVFSLLEGHPAIDGEMNGAVWLKCQRCLQPVAVPIAENFRVVLVGDEDADPEQFGGYEPIAVDVSRLDLQWLAEEQALLALPLVPLHEEGICVEAQEAPAALAAETGQAGTQKPFGNLRDLLQKR